MDNAEIYPAKHTILLVDDTPANLQLLTELLSKQGYRIRSTPNGVRALSSVQKSPPDLILLDIMMPEMDGYEVCRQLKADDNTRGIPIIFISALDEVFDKVTAFSAGGVDYITKPFQELEVLARVKTHLALQEISRRLQEQNVQLDQQNQELDAFTHTVAHDLKTPLSAFVGYSTLLEESVSDWSAEEIQQMAHRLAQIGYKMTTIVNELLLLASVRKRDEVATTPLDMEEIVNKALVRLEHHIAQTQADVQMSDGWPISVGYAPWVEEVWANYLSNGLKYGGRPPRLELGATRQTDGMIRFWVRDNGKGLTAEAQAVLFTEFTQLSELRVEGNGLGLSIVRRIVEKLGGQSDVESEGVPDQGSVFSFTLPAAEPMG